jgi:thiol-disulfide isomerase/thioredoxin
MRETQFMMAQLGQKAPNLGVSKWVQGMPTNIDQEKDHVVVVEVFQVNCPGCFLYGIPEAINIYNKYKDDGVRVLGIATAFEDFDKNTLENLELLAKTGEVIGETKKALTQYGKIIDGNKIPYL